MVSRSVVNRSIANRSKIYFFSVCFSFIWNTSPCLAADLVVSLSSHQIELGKSVTLSIKSTGVKKSLANIDTSLLEKDFYIKETSDVISDNKKDSQIISIRLYPRSTGSKIISAISFHDVKSVLTQLVVTPAIDPKTKQPIRLKFEFEKKKLWVKQQWLLKAKIYSNEKYIVLDAAEKNINDFNVIPIKAKIYKSDANNNFVYETGWAVFPSRADEYRVQLPAIKYYRDGVNTHRFYPPVVSLNVKSLPSYVPGTMPVGKLSLTTSEKQTGIFITSKLAERVVTVKGEGITLPDLPVYKPKISANSAIVYYPVNKSGRQLTTHEGVTSLSHFSVPFVIQKMGFSRFPKVQMQYFDPDTGKIQLLSYGNKTYLALNYGLLTILVITGMALIVWLSGKLYQFLKDHLNFIVTYLGAIQEIRQSKNHYQLKSALQKLAAAEGLAANTTLLKLKQYLAEKSPKSQPYLSSVDKLMRHLYRGDETGLGKIKEDMKIVCLTRLPMFGYFIK